MAGLDDVFTAFKMFNEGVKEYAVGEGIRGAQQQMDDLNKAQMDEVHKRVQQQQIANNLSLRLSQIGTPVSQIQQALQPLTPKELKTPEDLFNEAILKKDQGLMDLANAAQDFKQRPEIQKQQFEMQKQAEAAKQALEKQGAEITSQQKIEGMKEGSALKIAELMNQTKLDVQGIKNNQTAGKLKQLPPTAAKPITDFNSVEVTGNDLLGKVNTNEDLVGPGASMNPLRRFSPEKASFDTEVGRWFQQYRTSVTGAQASDKEIARLEKLMPTINDTPPVFRQKIKEILTLGNQVKTRYIKTYSDLKYDVSGLTKDWSAAAEWIRQNPTDPRALEMQKYMPGAK